MTPARLGFLVALLTLVLDQASKLYLLFVAELPIRDPIVLAPFLELVVVWNRGISYGLLQQDGPLGRIVLLGISLIACVVLVLWLRQPGSRLQAWALGLVLGGAAGNAIDRLAYGAVADFVLLHAGGFEWYVFNIADAAIVVGVALLLYGALRPETRAA